MKIVETVRIRTRSYVDALGARLARTTPRERILLGALAVGAVLYAPIAALDARDRAETAYADALSARDTARRARVQAVNASNTAARDLAIQDMNEWGFEGSNVSIVSVRIEQALRDAATEAGMTGMTVTTNDAATTTGPVTWVSAEVQSDLLWTPAFALLDDVAAWPEGFRVTRFAFEKAPPPAFEGATVLQPGRVTIGFDFPTRTAMVEDAGA